MEDISQIFAIEVKQELAQRYFGFRKQIETEIENHHQQKTSFTQSHFPGIAIDFHRFLAVLGSNFFDTFLEMIGILPSLGHHFLEKLQPSAEELNLESFRSIGLTRKARFRDRFFHIYSQFEKDLDVYRKAYTDLSEEQMEVKDRIQSFYRQNDISSILEFIRQIDGNDNMLMEAPNNLAEHRSRLEREMCIIPPPPVEDRKSVV
jgi:DNA repair exonuclease SbcCD ATPase subunit